YFLFQRSVAHRHLHSFPTRRSSDLADLERRRAVYRIPREFWKLRKQGVIIPFLLELCRPFQVGAAPFLRGFYFTGFREKTAHSEDRKSTRLNSSHRTISYAVFCLKK